MTPQGRPRARLRTGRTSRARGDALVRLPDPAWGLAKKHAEATNRRDGLLALLAFGTPLTRACHIHVERGRLTADDPETRDEVALLSPDLVARAVAWREADPDATHDGLDTWLRRTLTNAVRRDLEADGHLWADQVTVSVVVIRRRGREEIFALDHPGKVRAMLRNGRTDESRRFTEITARAANILGRAAEPLAAQLSALSEIPAVADALARLGDA
jgi:hypothetical protein